MKRAGGMEFQWTFCYITRLHEEATLLAPTLLHTMKNLIVATISTTIGLSSCSFLYCANKPRCLLAQDICSILI